MSQECLVYKLFNGSCMFGGGTRVGRSSVYSGQVCGGSWEGGPGGQVTGIFRAGMWGKLESGRAWGGVRVSRGG